MFSHYVLLALPGCFLTANTCLFHRRPWLIRGLSKRSRSCTTGQNTALVRYSSISAGSCRDVQAICANQSHTAGMQAQVCGAYGCWCCTLCCHLPLLLPSLSLLHYFSPPLHPRIRLRYARRERRSDVLGLYRFSTGRVALPQTAGLGYAAIPISICKPLCGVCGLAGTPPFSCLNLSNPPRRAPTVCRGSQHSPTPFSALWKENYANNFGQWMEERNILTDEVTGHVKVISGK